MKKNLISACPTGPEWNALVNHPEIGMFNAMRDWLEQDGDIRPVDVVLDEVRRRNPTKNGTQEQLDEQAASDQPESIISEETQKEYESKLRSKLLDFVKGLNIYVDTEADDLLSQFDWKAGDPMTGFDMLQKFLALRRDASLGDLRLQVANIVYSFLGRKSKISLELWKNVHKWSKYQSIYDMYDKVEGVDQNEQIEEIDDMPDTIDVDRDGSSVTLPDKRYIENKWAHKQVIMHLLAEALEVGVDMKRFSQNKQMNVDIDKEYFEKLGYKNKFEQSWLKRTLNKIWNAFVSFIWNPTIVRKFNEAELINLAMELADDVYKKDFTKFIRAHSLQEDGTMFDSKKNEILEQKDYNRTIANDPYAASIISKLNSNPFVKFYTSGSLSLRRFGTLFRSVSEDLHDIDGVIPFDVFKNEMNALDFRNWIQEKGLELQYKSRISGTNKAFLKGIRPYLEAQNWYKTVKSEFPTWELTNVFIGRDHKKGESITIQGTIEHPTMKDPKDPSKPFKYNFDFFLRTMETGNFPEKFDNYFKDWKEIFEAKINMGRAKDISDLVYWTPFRPDDRQYKFMNKGFRFFTFKPGTARTQGSYSTPLPFIRRAYHGYKSDKGANKQYRYFTYDENEAQEYGDKIKLYDIRINEFLNVKENTDTYDKLTHEFYKTTGKYFNMMDTTPEGNQIQEDFFKFLMEKGYRGLDFSGYSDSRYLISFYPKVDSIPSPRSAKASFSRYNRLHQNALQRLTNSLDSAGYNLTDSGWITGRLSSYDVGRIESFIRAAYAPDNWTLRKVRDDLWYVAGYKNQNVFKPEYWSPATSRAGYSRYNQDMSMSDITLTDYSKEVKEGTGETLQMTPQDIYNMMSVSNMSAFLDALQNNVGVQYKIITEEEARVMLQNTPIKYGGETAFAFGENIYFVGDNITPGLALHEFAHPILRAIRNTNPKLFKKMYYDFLNTEEGSAVLREVTDLYREPQEIDQEFGADPYFMEEVMARGIELKAMRKRTDTGSTKGFLDWVKNMLYQFKKMIKEVAKKIGISKGMAESPKINVSKLSENTTLNELAEMLSTGKAFDLKPVNMNEDPRAAFSRYIREQQKEIQGLIEVAPASLTEIATQGMRATSVILNRIKKQKNYPEMLEVLKDEFGKSNIDEIRSNLRPYTDYMERRLDEMIDELSYNTNQVEALVNTFFRLRTSMKKMTDHLQMINQDINDPDNLARAMSYQKVIKAWDTFIQYTIEIFNNNQLGADNPVFALVNSINTQISKAKEQLSAIKSSSVRDYLYNIMTPFNAAAFERFQQMEKTYRKYKYKQWAIDRLYVEYYGLTEAEFKEFEKMKNTGQEQSKRYEKLLEKSFTGAQVTPEKIDAILSGDLTDVNWLSSYFESYLYNDDPVVGGLALFVKQALDKTLLKSQAMMNDFQSDLVEDLRRVGYNPYNIGELGKRVGFIDSYGVERDGELKEFKVWTLLNPWKGYRFEIDKLKYEIRKAREEYYKLGTDASKKKLNEAIRALEEHDLKWMYNTYVPEYYTIRSDFTEKGTNALAVEALRRRDEVLATIRNYQEKVLPADETVIEEKDLMDLEWAKYRELHSLYDMNGKMKQGEELAIAKELLRFREMSRKFYEYNYIDGSFENALFKYEQKLINKNIRGADFERMRRAWINKNTRVKIKKEFWTKRRELLERKKEILSKSRNPNVAEEQRKLNDRLDEAYSKMFDLTAGFKDDDYQIEATSMSPSTLKEIKNLQEEINDIRENLIGVSGLSRKDRKRLRELDSKEFLTTAEEAEYGNLYQKKNSSISLVDRRILRNIFKELDGLSTTEATDYYVDSFNDLMEVVLSEEKDNTLADLIRGHFGSTRLEKEDMEDIISPDDTNRFILTSLLNNSKFKEWFDNNHTQSVEFDYKSDTDVVVYKRTYAWNVTRPVDEDYYEGYEIKDENGRIIERIPRLPNLRFYKRDVKKEFMTGYDPELENPDGTKGDVNLIVGKHIDNKNRWLPREDVPNSIYRNEEYYNLKNTNKDLFNVLEKLTKWQLKIQEDLLDNSSKNYLDFPRFEKTALELGLSKSSEKEKISRWKLLVKNLKQFFVGSQDEPESGFGYSDKFKVAQLDLFDDDENNEYQAPIQGLYDIEHDDVSTDITNSLLRYMMSAHKNATLTEIYPMAGALKDVLDGKGYDRFKKIAKRHLSNDGEFTSRDTDTNKTRRKAVDNFIDREFFGQTLTGPGADNKVVYNLSNGIFQAASLGFFAFNVQSAVKNWSGQVIQGLTEGISGRFYNTKDWAYGTGWSVATMGELSFQIYKQGPKSLNVQLWEIFDPMHEFHKKAAKEGMSRTLAKDLSQPAGIAMNFRKWTEMQSQMHVFAAMMHNVLVKQNGKDIRWVNAWEVVDGKIRLKEGVDPEWGITYDKDGKMSMGQKFILKRQEMQAVLAKLQGAYDDFNQPEAQRQMAFRFINFMRRYFLPMFIDRFGFKYKNGRIQARAQPGLGNLAEGWYVSISRHLLDSLRMGPRRFITATPEERGAYMKAIGDGVILYLLAWMLGALFGWDDNDEDRYNKLREKSGPMPGPFIADSEYDFHFKGWLANHALTLAMQVRAENAQFIPWPGLGLRNYKELISEWSSSAAIGPTVGTAFSLTQDLYNLGTGSEKAFYQRGVGPYDFQQEDSFKALNHLAKSAGFTGVFFDPVLGLKKQESIEQGFASGGQ